jgi:endonuclease G
MKKWIPCLVMAGLYFFTGYGQSVEEKLQAAGKKFDSLEQQKQQLLSQIEDLKLKKIREDLQKMGLPSLQAGEELVEHEAMYLAYAEKFEQARWVAHIIPPDVLSGTVFRTNDFRIDEKVKTGSTEEADYFLKKLKPDSTWEYDGFGYDRGHLAPSADFRWSQKALSESYFYSNMSPQLPEFNRGIWGSLEDKIRGYLYGHPNTSLYIVTGPVLKQGLPVIERSIHKPAIPESYWKVALDPINKKAIGFILPNKGSDESLAGFAVPINKIEELTGLDFFAKLPDDEEEKLESQVDVSDWLPASVLGNATPLDPTSLPRNHINTTQADGFKNQKYAISVCGKVVSSRLSRAGNVLLNLDKQFPNQVFTVFIKKEDIINFSFDPVTELKGKTICVKGKVILLGDTTGMYLENEKALKFYEEQEH